MDIGMRSLHPAAADHSVSIRGSRCTALIILSLRSRAVVFTTALPDATEASRVRALQHGSGGRGLTGGRETVPVKTVTQECAVASSPACFSTKELISLKEYTGDRVFLKMSYHPCVSGCGRSLAPQDGHDHCLTCLGIQHAEEAFVDGSCSSCGDMTISELQ